MMKKRVLMPLMMAGMMVASLVALDSCKKTEPQQAKISVEQGDPIIISDRDASRECPYCHNMLLNNETHWHYFGTPIPGFDINEMMEMDRPGGIPHFWAVDDCVDGCGGGCHYSGIYHDDPAVIQEVIDIYLTDKGIVLTPEEANTLLLQRFHAHCITYRAIIGGQSTHGWHVGGGVPGWPNP